MKLRIFLGFVLAAASLGVSSIAKGEMPGGEMPGTAFTYQGHLKQAGEPANGPHDFEFGLWDAGIGGNQIHGTQVLPGVPVTDGLFTVTIDFGEGTNQNAAFNGQARWLEITVDGTPLAPRQPLTPTPIALSLPGLWTQQVGPSPNLIGGYHGNIMGPGVVGGTIGGGGEPNFENSVSGSFGTVAGGRFNSAENSFATVGGGINNVASGDRAFVGGGTGNIASGYGSVVTGGDNNNATGSYSAVLAGKNNEANGQNSFAGGKEAYADHSDSFVWNTIDSPQLHTDGQDQWRVRANGGFWIYTGTDNNTGAWLPPGQGQWQNFSDRNAKENIRTIDEVSILDRLVGIPITTWNYKEQGASVRHIGPMAQDFRAAFEVGIDEKSIATGDADGVALAAIQGLYQLVQGKDREIGDLKARLTVLEALVEQLARSNEGSTK